MKGTNHKNSTVKKAPEITAEDVLRPLKLSILLSILGEAVILVVWGIVLYPEGNLLHKFLWAIVFCGLGMGAAIGAIIALVVVGRWTGAFAVIFCAELSAIVLGLFCNYLCYSLDMHFNYFGSNETPLLFFISGIVMATIGGAIVGWFCFTEKGKRILSKYKL
ncbi:hypothetical protein MTsPCn5_09750 [Croceitalea sp. MTPC5]|uniref:hypothetical protein n=1 Tax=Croceitalea sp. MTPC5 TaxID=3056565 RepID=UPI002B3C7755|nr:hypothetical protein MTsPCn5_09750 [Croceitalea sp. MTPC5]